MEHRIPLKIVLLNNGYLGMVRQWQAMFFDKRYAETPMHGPDFISIARGFMLSVGCIRARHCANADGKTCPVGIATLNKGKRNSFIISKQADRVENYHNQLISSVKSIMAVIGAKNINEITKNKLLFIEKNKIFFNIDDYFSKKLN